MADKIGFHTRAAKTYLDGRKVRRPLTIPIMQGNIFQIESSEMLGNLFKEGADEVYTRFGNPTLTAACQKCAELEDADSALLFSSGMGAISTSLLTVLRSGDHVVTQQNIFAQTFTFLTVVGKSLGIESSFVNASNPEEVRTAIRPSTKLIYIETPSNPLLQIVDIRAVSRIAQEKNLPLFVDNTFATPYVQKPITLGADLVLHSGSKYFAGHNDLMCGIAAGKASLIKRIRQMQILLGNILDPHAAWVLLRGIKTLGVRVQRQSENAFALARFLESQKNIVHVNYPWLESSSQFRVAHEQMSCGGGMLSFEPAGGVEASRTFLNALELITVATSLGGVESVIEIPSDLDFSSEELGEGSKQMAISSGLVRLSVGIEDVNDLKSDLQRGLDAIDS